VFACRFGRGRSDAEKFLAALQDVYCLERVRVLGDDIRLLKCYPGDWQVSLNPRRISPKHLQTLHHVCWEMISACSSATLVTGR